MKRGSAPLSLCLFTTTAPIGKQRSVVTTLSPFSRGTIPKAVLTPTLALGTNATSPSEAPMIVAKSL